MEELIKIAENSSAHYEDRVKSILDLAELDLNRSIEIINVIITSYGFLQTENLADLIKLLCLSDTYYILRYISIMGLKDEGIEVFEYLKELLKSILDGKYLGFSFSLEIETFLAYIEAYFKNIDDGELMMEFMEYILNKQKVDIDSKYDIWCKVKKSISVKVEEEYAKEVIRCVFVNSYRYFIDNGKHLHKINACQYFIHNNIDKIESISICLSIAEDEKLEEKTRSNAADLILNSKMEGLSFNKAKNIIKTLGQGKKKINTLYNNAQNAHCEEFTQQIKDFLRELSEMDTKFKMEDFIKELDKYKEPDIIFEDEKYVNLDDYKKIINSLNRIEIDETVFDFNQKLDTIFLKSYQKIRNSKDYDFLLFRLFEELTEMYEECTSGHLIRIINAFSTIGVNLNIGFKKQIESNIIGRFQVYLNKDKEFKGIVLVDMVNDDIFKRPSFLKLHSKVIPIIRQELYKEFVTEQKLLSDGKFDDYFREGLSNNF